MDQNINLKSLKFIQNIIMQLPYYLYLFKLIKIMV